MSEWGVALIAAGSAVAGSIVTGWYTRSAGLRQAEAAKHAGERQADALLHTVQATLDEQRRARIDERRRQVYIEFLDVAESIERGNFSDVSPIVRALAAISLEGPESVLEGVEQVVDSFSQAHEARERSDGQATQEANAYHHARDRFLEIAKRVLDGDDQPEPSSTP
ncbi:hypothetical protein ACWEBX_16960 [Streptomyces sp. NPDC005070]